MSFKNIGLNDVANTVTLLHEAIPLTGTIVSGTYADNNIKNYTHGQFQSVYDYPYLSSSANHIFDLTIGYDESSALSSSSNTQNAKKINMYNQHAQVLVGYTGSDNSIRLFEADLVLDQSGSVMKECIFLNLSRLITKDEIKKGSVSITVGTGSHSTPFAFTKTFTDSAATSVAGFNNTIGGDYALLSSSADGVGGVVFYQAGVCILTASVFDGVTDFFSSSTGTSSIATTFTDNAISSSCDSFRRRLQNLSFNNTTEINSQIYFCRANHNEFNYSSNPTYISDSKIVVKDVSTDNPISYITTIGLYSSDNELLATAKVSEPLRKDPNNELTLRVRLDY